MTADRGARAPRAAPTTRGEPRLDILKALGDNTRYAIYLELARAAAPRSTADIATTLDLHANTVRPHLERMREVGLLEVRSEVRGVVGRPQHLYSIAADAPSLGLEPPLFPLLARMLLKLAAEAGIDGDLAADAGRAEGRIDANRRHCTGVPCVDTVMDQLESFGFDPARVDGGTLTTIAFGHCPFRELAEANPDLVCNLHRGLIEGVVDELGGASVEDFHDLSSREPCLVELETR
ncbi:MAG: hypothetical protein JJLCMIEE_01466 [Acidimicrobiales bacterium]|nr:MAG: hypothetical protein EDR02_06400 [Actinomycetota bacterium]MBV6508405.1 hypothetical protein [Acidimicrobiales bacterium]RIK04784.1 MAG: hypothetical protein DCC48_12095 [Acidobacteriota bacterium]